MKRTISLGRFYSTSSVLHSLDPRTKMFSLLAFIVSIFVSNTVVSLASTVAVLSVLVFLSNVPLKLMFRGFRMIILIVLLSDLINILTVDEGYIKAIIVSVRIFEIIIASNLLTLTTRPKDIADGIETSLDFLNKIKLPVHDFATMISIAVRFIPILSTESERIMEAQKARGADFGNKNIVKKAKSVVPVLIPLFVSAFRKADDMAIAMDSRLYGIGKTSRLYPLEYCKNDSIAYALSVLYLLVFIYLRFVCL